MFDGEQPDDEYGGNDDMPATPSAAQDVGATARFKQRLGRHPTAWRLIAAAIVIPLGPLIGFALGVTLTYRDLPVVADLIGGILFLVVPVACVATGIYLLTGAFPRRPSWEWRGLITLVVYMTTGAFLSPESYFDALWPNNLLVVFSCQMEWFCAGGI